LLVLKILSKHRNIPGLSIIRPERKFNLGSILKRRHTQHPHRTLLQSKRALMQKYIRSALPFDKAESFGRTKPNHFPFQSFHNITTYLSSKLLFK